jgi:NAD(P)-dependent dehydrogenase (short-subunit alcohol dehydrogenase family)
VRRSPSWLRDKNVLVTGAPSGIGRATALRFAKASAHVILCDRDADGLRAIERECARHTDVILAHALDVADRAAYAEFAGLVHAKIDAVDVLVNNAGVGLSGGILDTPLEDLDWVLSINLGGVIHGCHFFCPKMVTARRSGHVVNIASILGLFATHDSLGYSAAKFGVVGFSEALRAELHAHGVGVSTICPGMIDTSIVAKGRYRTRGDAEKIRSETVKTFARFGHSPEVVAAAIERAVLEDRALVPAAPEAWAFWWAKRAFPTTFGRVAGWLGGRIHDRFRARG